MSVRDFRIYHVPMTQEVYDFVARWHYAGEPNGVLVEHAFAMFDGYRLVGAALYGKLGMANAWRKYADSEDAVIELRRLCCTDDAPRNSESRLIGASLRWLAKNTLYDVVVSYADPAYGHVGTIYKACNFEHVGMTAPGRVIVTKDGKRYHDKCIRTKYRGTHKPFAAEIRRMLEQGDAWYEETPPKHIYIYRLDKHRRRLPQHLRHKQASLFDLHEEGA